jgi:hypothetical protein
MPENPVNWGRAFSAFYKMGLFFEGLSHRLPFPPLQVGGVFVSISLRAAQKSCENNMSMAKKTTDRPHWITIALALVAAGVSALGIWWSHQDHNPSATISAPVPSAPSLHAGNIRQATNGGTAVAGVQGNITVNGKPPRDQK